MSDEPETSAERRAAAPAEADPRAVLLARVPEHAREAVFDLVFGRAEGATAAALAHAVDDLTGLTPRDAVEARLAVLFLLATRAGVAEFARAATTTLVKQRDAALAMADRLTRTAAMLAEALDRRRRPAEQRIVVEQRVAVPDGGRAVVGVAVQAEGGGGDGRELEHQPHAPRLAHEPGAALRGADPERVPVPVAGGAGQGTMPDARRGQGQRRPGRRAERAVEARPAQRGGAGGADDGAAAAAAGEGRAGGPVTDG